MLDGEAGGELAAVQGPGQIGQAQSAIADGAGDAEAGGGDFVGAEELLDDDFKAGVILGPVDFVALVSACLG